MRRPLAFLLALGTGLGLAASEVQTEMSVRLPPFIVETPRGPAWRYLEIPRYEILSRCDRLTTENLALAFHRAHERLNLVLPPRFQLAFDRPKALILYDEDLWPAAEREAVATMLRNPENSAPPGLRLPSLDLPAGRPQAGKAAGGTATRDAFLSNVMLSDVDTNTTFVLVTGQSTDAFATFLTPGAVSDLLRGRIPALPEWFISTFLRLYQRMDLNSNRIVLRLNLETLKLRPAPGQASHQLEFLPWPAFFDPASPSDGQDPGVWLEQADLFVTWGIDPTAGPGAGFWNFLARVSTEPLTETLLRETLGMDFAQLDQRLSDYSFKTQKVQWTLPGRLGELPAGAVRDALPEEVARIMGEWERLETRYVAVNEPDLQIRYQELARRTLLKSYDRGDRDPRLVATLGLLELDSGHQALAQQYLESVATEPTLRPRACFELAMLRYQHEFGRSPRNDGKFTPEQTAAIAAPLLIAARQAPPVPQVFELLARVYDNSVTPPPPEVVAALAAGREFFPHGTTPKRWPVFSFPTTPQAN